MTEIYADAFSAREKKANADGSSETVVSTVLSALLIIGLPTTFWLVLLELVNRIFMLQLSGSVRIWVATALIGFLSLIWGFILISARQRQAM
jgi:hypothetical protein